MADKKNMEEVKEAIPVFTKEQILASSKYANFKDACTVVLSEGETYTLDEVDQKFDDFMKGKVK